MHYMLLIDDLLEEDPHFLSDKTIDLSKTATARTPPNVSKSIRKLKAIADLYIIKSKGMLSGRDLLHGTMVRYDSEVTGRLDLRQLTKACHALKCQISESDLIALVNWFDTNGTQMFDYNEFTRQLYGEDMGTKPIELPNLGANCALP
jgi:hypothetical protein